MALVSVLFFLLCSSTSTHSSINTQQYKELAECAIHDEIGTLFNLPINAEAEEENSRSRRRSHRRRMLTHPNTLSVFDKRAILDKHNELRSIVALGAEPETVRQPSATNMNHLFWDPALATVAANYASQCIWAHNPRRSRNALLYRNISSFEMPSMATYVGENLWATSASWIPSVSSLLSGIQSWFNEHQWYDYDSNSCASVCGHYTQIVTDRTRYIGCGWAACPAMVNLPSFGDANILVCNYWPAGNWAGRHAYDTDVDDGNSVCSECDGDRQECDNGLCAGCMSSSFETQGNIIPDDCNDGTDRYPFGGLPETDNPSTEETPHPTTTATTTTTADVQTPSPTTVRTPSPTEVQRRSTARPTARRRTRQRRPQQSPITAA